MAANRDDASDLDAAARRAATGEAGAVDTWFRREHPVVYRMCFGFLADAADAQDAAQDAMMHLHDHLGRWNDSRPYGAWRTTVVANLCRDRLRRQEVRAKAEDAARALASPSPLPDPRTAAERNEVRAILAGALATLAGREREVFVLRDLMGHPGLEVADALGIDESTVRTHLLLARRRLKHLLAHRLSPASEERDRGR